MCRDFSNLRECLSHLVSVCRAVVAQRWRQIPGSSDRSSDRCKTECWSADDSVLLGFFLGNSERRISNLCDHMVPITDPEGPPTHHDLSSDTFGRRKAARECRRPTAMRSQHNLAIVDPLEFCD
jgi:hypothetical protein